MPLSFIAAAATLVVLTLALLLRPQRRPNAPDARALNRQLYQEQLADPGLDAESRAEIERRALEDLAPATPATTPAASRLGRGTLAALIIGLPLAAAGLYRVLGTPEALDPTQVSAGAHDGDASQITAMVDGLARKLEQGQVEPSGWLMLGRSYHALGRMQQAVDAFARAPQELLGRDAQALAVYADSLGALHEGRLDDHAAALIEQALKLDPEHLMSLSLAAAAAHQRGDDATARRHWQKLLTLLPSDSEDAVWVRDQLARMTGAMPAPAAAAAASAAPAATRALSGRVTVSAELAAQVPAGATLFLFARPESGSRMPLAIQRLRASDLPLDFRLDDSHAMSPQARLSDASRVVVEARISASGDARPAPGDLYGESAVVEPGAPALRIVIDRRR
jgi:cytochrome c-type biogenesis protein CcmH